MRKQQANLFDYFEMTETRKRYGRTQHGGLINKGRRKLERPFYSKKWMHLVLSSKKAAGKLSFLSPKNQIVTKRLIDQKAKKFGVVLGDYANVGNHLHLKVKTGTRIQFQSFLRSLTTELARKITGARRGHKFGRFWDGLAYSRVLTSPIEELRLKGYIEANRREARDSKFAREIFLLEFRRWVRKELKLSANLVAYSSG